MNYASARPKIRSGDLLGWSHHGWGSWYDIQVQLVRMFTRSRYSHVGVASVFGDRVMIYESVSAGVREFPLSRELPFYWIPMGLEWNDAADRFVYETLGDPYSKWQAIKAQLGLLVPGADKVWECAEWAMTLYERAFGMDPDCKATPEQLMAWALRREGGCEFYVEG